MTMVQFLANVAVALAAVAAAIVVRSVTFAMGVSPVWLGGLCRVCLCQSASLSRSVLFRSPRTTRRAERS